MSETRVIEVCRIDNGLCMTHGFSVSENVQCPEAIPTVKVGDVFYESWGYEQTNIDFAQVVALSKTGKTAICQMMSQKITSTEGLSSMAEMVVPDTVAGDTFKLLVRDADTLRGSYPFCNNKDSKRFGIFSRWKGEPVYQSHYA
jgi:hypothetical protein